MPTTYRWKLFSTTLALSGSLLLVFGGCSYDPFPPITEITPNPTLVGNVFNLPQGWSNERQQAFWYTSQGSKIVPYDWFLVLEQADNTIPFRSDDNIERLRYIPAFPTADWNPDGVPVGFAKTDDWIGFTCAACHTARIDYEGVSFVIDGGPTMADMTIFIRDLTDALNTTLTEDAKFGRFANAILGSGHTPGQADSLRTDLEGVTQGLGERINLMASDVLNGYARIDAFGQIFNQALSYDLDLPQNAEPPNAPVSYPFLWDTPQHNRVQWNGVASNSPAGVGPLLRNTGEMVGVFGVVDVDTSRRPRDGYESSIAVGNLGLLEEWLERLWSPQWPKGMLPAIDAEQAANGRTHYEQYCLSCHADIDRTNAGRRITAVMTPLDSVGTDTQMATNFVSRVGDTGRLEGQRKFVIAGDRFGPTADGGDILGNVVAGVLLAELRDAIISSLVDFVVVTEDTTHNLRAYKARPLNGIWATAPYLHNGSVPSLYALLQPAAERPDTFRVGSREFDPVNVGYVNTGGFLFDTSVPGNRNVGHEYGTAELTEEQRRELVEYLKSL